MAVPVGMPILEVATATTGGNPTPALEPILEADMVILPDPLIPGQESILVGVAVTMADMGITEAAGTMADADIMAADMATSAGEVSI